MNENIDFEKFAKMLSRDNVSGEAAMRVVVAAMLDGAATQIQKLTEDLGKVAQQVADATELLCREKYFDVELERDSAGEVVRVRVTDKTSKEGA